MSKVFVVQVPARRSGPGGAWEEKYDLSPAEDFGEIVRLLTYGNISQDETAVAAARLVLLDGLGDFDTDEDYLLLLGDPVACAMAVQTLVGKLDVPSFNVLKWDRRKREYEPFLIS